MARPWTRGKGGARLHEYTKEDIDEERIGECHSVQLIHIRANRPDSPSLYTVLAIPLSPAWNSLGSAELEVSSENGCELEND